VEILPQLILNSIIAGAIYMMIALGFNLIYGTVKFFDLGYGALITVGGYMVFLFYKKMGLDLSLSIALGILISGGVAYLINKVVYKKLRDRKASNMVMLVASIGVLTVIQAIIAMFFSSQFQTLSTGSESQTFQIFGAVITQVQLIILITGLLIMTILAIFLKKTLFGKAMSAVANDEEVSKIVGINTNKIISGVFIIGGMIAGLAGVFIGFDTGIEPTMGMSLLLKGVIACIIGGIGNIYGGVLGAFLLGFVENFGIWKISGEWKDAIAFGLFIIFLLFRPQGILKK
jgi:branched-chain amino acid transport system permease protein